MAVYLGSTRVSLVGGTKNLTGGISLQEKNVDPSDGKYLTSVVVDVPTDSGSPANLGTKSISANGVYDASNDGLDGYNQVSVDVQPSLQTKTVSPTESAQDITPDASYDGLSKVTVNAISSTYVGSGVNRLSAQTITPGTSNQTISAGQYVSGNITIAGDADLVGGNILSTANIFNVQGTVVVQKYYTGSTEPSSGLGNDGDLYLMI